MRSPRIFKVLALLVIFAMLAAACGDDDGATTETTSAGSTTVATSAGSTTEAPTTTVAAPTSGGELIVVQVQEPIGFDSSQFATGNHTFLHNLYDTLTILDDVTGVPQPQVATDWNFNDDATSLTMTLRDDVVFHDGSPLTSQDVVFTWEYLVDPDIGSNLRSRLGNVTSIDTPDDYTVVWNFSRPQPGFFAILNDFFLINEAQIADVVTMGAGSGPFLLGEVVPGDSFTMVKNPAYWDEGLPYFDSVKVRIIADREAQAAALLSGEADYIQDMEVNGALRVEQTAGYVLVKAAAGSNAPYVQMRVDHPPFDNPLVRQAIAYAIDRETITNIAFPGGSAVPATEGGCQPFPPNSFWNTQGYVMDTCEFNLEKARTLLAEAGFPDGFQTSVNVSNNYGPPKTPDMAQILQQDLAEIGVELTINVLEGADARAKLLDGDFDMVIHTYSAANADASFNHPSRTFGPADNSFGGFTSPEFVTASNDCSSLADPQLRKAACNEMSKILDASAHVNLLAYTYTLFGMSEDLQGFAIDTSGHPLMKYWWLDR